MNHLDARGSGLVLVGYRGTGKSTVGRLLAERLGREFADADVALEAKFGLPVRAIFQERGEPYFRDCEEQVIAELTASPGQVIATGGGAVLRETNRNTLRRYGLVIWLTASADEIGRRLATNPQHVAGRPALTALGTLNEISKVLEARISDYKAASDLSVSTEGLSPDEVALAILPRVSNAVLDFGAPL